jgi:hypothetical protein
MRRKKKRGGRGSKPDFGLAREIAPEQTQRGAELEIFTAQDQKAALEKKFSLLFSSCFFNLL